MAVSTTEKETGQKKKPVSRTKTYNSTRGRWKKVFIDALSQTGNVTRSAITADVDRAFAYQTYSKDKSFAADWDDALERAADVLEEEAWRRATEGCKRPIYQGGVLVGYVQEYSDTLMCLLLKAHKPTKYRERSENILHVEDYTPQVIAVQDFKGFGKKKK